LTLQSVTASLTLGISRLRVNELLYQYTLKEDNRLKVFENRVLMRIFGLKEGMYMRS
jgi:hypothetical protein